jgi:hypothetical protein
MWLWRCAKHQKRESERGNTRTVSEVTKCRAAGTGESPGRWNALSWLSEFPTACTRLAVRGWGWLVWTGPTKPGKGAVDCFSRAGGCYGRRYPPPAQVFFIRTALGRSPPDGQGPRGIQSRHWIEFQDAVQNKQDLKRNPMAPSRDSSKQILGPVPAETLRILLPSRPDHDWHPGPQFFPEHFEVPSS